MAKDIFNGAIEPHNTNEKDQQELEMSARLDEDYVQSIQTPIQNKYDQDILIYQTLLDKIKFIAD